MNKYIYKRFASSSKDTVGDERDCDINGVTFNQICIISNDFKGGGTWINTTDIGVPTKKIFITELEFTCQLCGGSQPFYGGIVTLPICDKCKSALNKLIQEAK
jgi:hypothetical protein